MQHKIKKALLKLNNEVIATMNAQEETLCEIENFKCTLAIHYNVCVDEIEVEFDEETIELGETFITVSNKWCQYNGHWHPEEIGGVKMGVWVNLKTQEGIDMLCDYIKIGRADELMIFTDSKN